MIEKALTSSEVIDDCLLRWNRIVIKKDGLAEGKGVFLPKTRDEAISILESLGSNWVEDE